MLPRLDIFVGYDASEHEAYKVCEWSLARHTNRPLHVYPLKHRELRRHGLFDRPWRIDGPTGQMIDERDNTPCSTEFSFTRFLVPAYAKYLDVPSQWVMFVDCDFLFTTNVEELFDLADDTKGLMVVQQAHDPIQERKMDYVMQTRYPRKNWSSLMLFNRANEFVRELTPMMVNTKPGAWLHQLKWIPDRLIGNLPVEWNWIEGVTPNTVKPKAIHYSAGGPWFPNCQEVAYAAEWKKAQALCRM